MALIIVFHNVSALADVSDYNVQVLIGDGSPARSKTIYAGRHEGHRRSDGWQALVADWLKKLEGPNDPLHH